MVFLLYSVSAILLVSGGATALYGAGNLRTESGTTLALAGVVITCAGLLMLAVTACLGELRRIRRLVEAGDAAAPPLPQVLPPGMPPVMPPVAPAPAAPAAATGSDPARPAGAVLAGGAAVAAAASAAAATAFARSGSDEPSATTAGNDARDETARDAAEVDAEMAGDARARDDRDGGPEPSRHEPSLPEPSQHEPSQHEPSQHDPAAHEPTGHEQPGHEAAGDGKAGYETAWDPARPAHDPARDRGAAGEAAEGVAIHDPGNPGSAPETPRDEPDAVDAPALAPEARPGITLERTLVATYTSGENTYFMYSDGAIEADTPTGRYRFASMDELRTFVELGTGGVRIEPDTAPA